jgi:hypothetical protein
VREEVRIGAVEGSSEDQFGQVGGIAVDSNGHIFVLDQFAQNIKVYAADGTYERTVGTQGSGPGELRGAVDLLMGMGDTLLVPDPSNMRITCFGPDGSDIGSVPLRLEEGVPMGYGMTASGVFAEQLREYAWPGQPVPENREDVIRLRRTDGSIIDTVMTFPVGEMFGAGGDSQEVHVFAPEWRWDLRDDLRLLLGTTDRFRIEVYSARGVLERVITKPFESKPITAADIQIWTDYLERSYSSVGWSEETVALNLGRWHFAEVFPAFVWLASGREGSIWVNHALVPSDLTEEEIASFNVWEDQVAPEWDVFDSVGHYLGAVTLPRRFSARSFRGDKIYGVWRDDLDVQYVVRLGVISGAES